VKIFHLPFFIEVAGILLAVGMTFYLVGKRKEPQTILAWSLSFFLFPFLGPLLYLIFGETRMEKRVRTSRNPSYLRSPLDGRSDPLRKDPPPDEGPRHIPEHPLHFYASKVVQATQGFPPRPGNRVTFFPQGEAFFQRMFSAFSQARKTIYLMFYLIRADETGKECLEILRKKAEEGVRVRFLYDHWGSFSFHLSSLRRRYRRSFPMAPFMPLRLFKPALNANFRNHRKLAIVDHELAFMGGINIANEYRYGIWEGTPWVDLGVEVRGPVVRDLEVVFCEDWFFTTGEELDACPFPPRFPGGTPVQVVTGGPDHPLEPISYLVTTILSRCNHEAVLVTPYFIPDPPLLHMFASLKLRGGKINLIMPERGNHFWVHRATESYCQDLFAMGIEPWIFETGMIHTKLLWADGLLALVGSPNLDIRSLKLNFEIGLMIFDPVDLRKVEEIIEEILQHSTPLTPEMYRRFSATRKILNRIARVMSPIF
jgi:cardiolipin synthase